MTETENKALYIAEQCRKAGMTLAGAAGVLANVEAESAFSSTNLQDCYNSSLHVSDADYTAQVDAGARGFTDSAGYGLAQWTSGDRKYSLLSYAGKRGVSIGNFEMQVDFLLEEMRTGYREAWSTCTTSDDPYQCGYMVCKRYEIPADTENQANQRGNRAGYWYKFLEAAMQQGQESTIPSNDNHTNYNNVDDDGITIPKTWPPRTIDENCEGWPEVWLLQAALRCHGFNVVVDGIYAEALKKKVATYQQAYDLGQDGVVGPKTWAAILKIED